MAIALSDLRTRILERADMLNSQFISTAELNAIINGEGAELHDLVVSRFEDQFTTSLNFSITSGNSYPLTSTFYKLRGVDFDDGNGQFNAIRKYDWAARNRRVAGGFWRSRTLSYRLVGSNLLITPDDQALGNYRLWYIPPYVDLVADGDLLDYPQYWHECVIAGGAAKCLAKEESDPSAQFQLKAAMQQRIMAMAANRDAGAPERVERVRRNYDYDDDC